MIGFGYEGGQMEVFDTVYGLKLTGAGKGLGAARCNYSDFVENGIGQGQRPDRVGRDPFRSHGGWAGVKALKEAGEYKKAMSAFWVTGRL
jgi:hypothetical protein